MKRLTENVALLGNGYFNFFLVGKKEAALVECGTRAGAAVLKEQWSELEEKPEVKYLVMLHSHFDHSCGLPLLQEMFPEAQVLGSAVTQKFLSKPKIVNKFSYSDAVVAEKYFEAGLVKEKPDTSILDTLTIDRVVGEGDILQLGEGLQLRFIDTPGHSHCSLAAYLESDQALFCSDSAGTQVEPGLVTASFFQDYNLYVETIKKMSAYPVQLLGPGHGPVYLRDEVPGAFRKSLAVAEETFALIKAALQAGKTDDDLAGELFDRSIKGPLSYYPVDTMMQSMHLLIKNVKAIM